MRSVRKVIRRYRDQAFNVEISRGQECLRSFNVPQDSGLKRKVAHTAIYGQGNRVQGPHELDEKKDEMR